MRKALFLIALGAIYRLLPHPWNAVPMGALAVYAGASFPLRWAWVVPVAAMGISDFVLDYAVGLPFLAMYRWVNYAAFALITCLGPLARRPRIGPLMLPGLSLAASGIFFLVSNFGAWLSPELGYPRTLGGLTACYIAAIPFLDETVIADLAGTALFFGMDAVISWIRAWRTSLLAPAAVSIQDVQD